MMCRLGKNATPADRLLDKHILEEVVQKVPENPSESAPF
jgi:hypothetical protein